MKPSLLLAIAVFCAPGIVSAQTSGADSAQAVLNAAQVLQREGQNDIARDLMRYLVRRWPESPAAATARGQFPTLPTESLGGFGRTSFVAYHVLYGAFLGAAIPAALGADDPEGYGLGLLLGAPLGFFASKAYAKNPAITDGQAGIIQFGSFWGTWQGFGWQSVLDIGEDEFCDVDVCYTSDSDTAPWAMAVAGGLTGLGVSLLAARKPISGGMSSMVFHSSLWGTYFGLATAILAEGDDNTGDGDDRLTAALIGGNIGLLLAIPAAKAWKPTSSRVRIASATGLAGGLAGLGVVLLTSTDDTQGAIAITTAGAAIGLVAGAALGKDNDKLANLSLPIAPALVSGVGKAKLGIPLPYPAKGGVGWSLVDFRF